MISGKNNSKPLTDYKNEPIKFIKEILKIPYLTNEQKEILLSIRDNRVTNVQAAHGVGKSYISSLAVLWWVFAREGIAITTAPTRNQVEKILWREIAKTFDKHQTVLGGERGKAFLRMSTDAPYSAWGFTAVSYKPDVFQGIHAEQLLVIQDEANGISEEIDNGAISCTTGANNRLLRIGNPVHGGTPFQKACDISHTRIPAWSHPNVSWAYQQNPDGIHRLNPEIETQISYKDPKGRRIFLPEDKWPDLIKMRRNIIIPGAISIDWIEGVREKYGEDSAFWEGRVEGRFPSNSLNCAIIPASWFEAARARYDNDPAYWDGVASKSSWRHGLDVGDGGDSHAIASWKGPVLYKLDLIPTKGDRLDVSRAAQLGIAKLKELGGTLSVDRIGVGAGALSEILTKLQDSNSQISAIGCNFGGASTNPEQFENIRAEQYWRLREAFQNNEIAIAPLGDKEEQIITGFANIMYDETPTGKMKLEPKKFVRQRLKRSPDAEDAIVIGFNCPSVSLSQQPITVGGKRSVVGLLKRY